MQRDDLGYIGEGAFRVENECFVGVAGGAPVALRQSLIAKLPGYEPRVSGREQAQWPPGAAWEILRGRGRPVDGRSAAVVGGVSGWAGDEDGEGDGERVIDRLNWKNWGTSRLSPGFLSGVRSVRLSPGFPASLLPES